MSKASRRAVSTAQVNLRMLNFKIIDTATTPVEAGFDRFGISKVIDLGAGNYTVIFKSPFERDCMLVGHSLDDAGILSVVAVAYDRITIQIDSDFAATGADIDCSLCVAGSDHRFDY